MSYEENFKAVLTELDEKSELNEVQTLPHIPRPDFFNIIDDLFSEGYIKSTWTRGPLSRNKDGAFIDPHLSITRKGHAFLDGKQETSSTGNSYNFHAPVSGANIGNHGTINNHYGASLSEFYSLLESITDDKEKQQGVELAEVLKKEEPIKPGMLSKFDSFLGKHRNIAELTGKILLTTATKYIEINN